MVETLLDAGVPIDEIGGVSLGAIVGAALAHGASPEEAYGHAVRACPADRDGRGRAGAPKHPDLVGDMTAR